MTKVLVACVDYPAEDNLAMQFVHVRNKAYVEAGIEVAVLNFSASADYHYEGINVYSLKTIENEIDKYKEHLLVCHAPNIRNHYRFIIKYKNSFKNKLFFFHGHEIVKLSKAYPKEYKFVKKSIIKKIIRTIYDDFKLYVWKNYFRKKDTVSKLVFVSEALKKDFISYVRITEKELEGRYEIINNSVAKIFENERYDHNCEKEYDFITIRSDVDSSVYCIDLIVSITKNNLDKSFLLIGRGDYFIHNEKPSNLTFINCQMKQEELIKYINKAKTALMPTRRDSQGVMACEMATFGIPLYTSSLDVCREMFSDFDNVVLCTENKFVREPITTIGYKSVINKKFFKENTIYKEIEIIKEL